MNLMNLSIVSPLLVLVSQLVNMSISFKVEAHIPALLCCCALTHGGLLTLTSDLPVEGQKVNIGQSVLLLQRLHGDDVEM